MSRLHCPPAERVTHPPHSHLCHHARQEPGGAELWLRNAAVSPRHDWCHCKSCPSRVWGGAQRRACAPAVVEFPGSALLCSALLCSALLCLYPKLTHFPNDTQVSILLALYAPITQAGWNPARDFGPRIVAALGGCECFEMGRDRSRRRSTQPDCNTRTRTQGGPWPFPVPREGFGFTSSALFWADRSAPFSQSTSCGATPWRRLLSAGPRSS